MNQESQHTVCAWAEKTFGDCTPQVAFDRMLEEIDELTDLKGVDPSLIEFGLKVRDECADIIITMFRVAEKLDFDLLKAVDCKMALNRERKWKVSPQGIGYHV